MKTATYLQCTRPVLEHFGLDPKEIAEAPSATSRLGNWTMNRICIADRVAYLFMSDRTYLSFPILEGKESVQFTDLSAFLQHGVTLLLEGLNVSKLVIATVIAEFEAVAIARATDRSTLAMHAAVAADYAHMARGFGGLGTHNLSKAISMVNGLPRRKLNWSTSEEVTLELLGASAA